MSWFSNHCGRYREDICLLANGALPAGESDEVRGHLAECGNCRAYYEDIKRVAAPLANWERYFTQIEPNPAMQMRWAKAIEAATEPRSPHSSQSWGSVFWRELVWPCRHAWTGMAALWFVMLWINVGSSDHRQATMNARSAPAAEVWQALEERRRLLAELVPPALSQPAEPPRQNGPRPRSERRQHWAIA